MMLSPRVFFKILILSFGLLVLKNAKGQKQNPYSATPLIGDSIKKGKTLSVSDTLFFNNTLNKLISKTNKIDNIISLQLVESGNKIIPDSFNLKVFISTVFINAVGSSQKKKDTLTIAHSKNNAYAGTSIRLYENMYSAVVTIDNVIAAGAPLNTILPFCRLDNTISIDRFYITDCSNGISSIFYNTPINSEFDELNVSWPAKQFSFGYDLEWTFIDKGALDAGFYNNGNGPDPKLIFKNNSSRVRINGTSYNIPMFYEGDGTLFFRVRNLQNSGNGEMVATPWSAEIASSGLGSFNYSGHQTKFNWQASTTFAEGGKRKSVVSYFDGNLKSRQTVTKDNTTGSTIVAETFYDNQGRAVIQVLPAPTLNKIISYSSLFNTSDINGVEYDKSVYDGITSGSYFCSKGAPAMKSATGSSNYYSANNPEVNNSFNRFIPDAKSFPFTETRYTRDNTGRIDKQSGVGDLFQIGKGHETQYYYGVPEQQSLDALFGSEAGEVSHYAKNMVRDANGQYSVSYIDMNGKTVATALAGHAPASLQKLSSYREAQITESLLSPSNNVVVENSITSSSSILVPVQNTYFFNYGMAAGKLTVADCKNQNICYDCLYDLTISISDNCNNSQFGGSPKIITKSNFKLFQIDTTCQQVDPMDVNFSVSLTEGSYDITKVLSISKYAMEYYRDSLFVPHNTCKPYEDILKDQIKILQSEADCTPQQEQQNFVDACRDQMLADLIPGSGQYAGIDPSAGYTIFGLTPRGFKLYYRFQTVTGYVDENGNPDSVYNSNGDKVPPEKLSPKEFQANFKESWTAALMPLHPEYKLYVYYNSMHDDFNWVEDFSNTNTFEEARNKGYLNPSGSSNSLLSGLPATTQGDPLFAHPYRPMVIHDIEDSLFNFLKENNHIISAWGVSNGLIKCIGPDNNNYQESCFLSWDQSNMIFNPSQLCTGELDMAWRNFKSFYLRIRDRWVDNFNRKQSGLLTSPSNPYVPVFPNFDQAMAQGNYTGNISPDTIQARSNFNNYLNENCKAYAIRWWQQLEPCNYTKADSAVIIPYLISVCREGADADHQFGSSTVAPTSSYRFRSFDEVIKFYNDSAYNGQKNHNYCNAYLIDKPLPYNVSRPVVNQLLIKKPSDCACSRISSLYNEFLSAHNDLNFSNYLFRVYQTSIKQSALDSLLSLCNGTITCSYLSKPISVPVVLQCEQQSACVPCRVYQNQKDSFSIAFPGLTPAIPENDTLQQHTNKLFENYLNAHLGFNKTAVEYLQFSAACEAVSCDSLSVIYNDYKKIYLNTDSAWKTDRFVDLKMTTFEGNETPDEGPKGVFDADGFFLDNTIDGTIPQINNSFAEIWNRSLVDKNIGFLEALSSGKFRLHLKPNSFPPCNGIIGMRYYQFDSYLFYGPNYSDQTPLRGVLTGPGSFIDFGDNTRGAIDTLGFNIYSVAWNGNYSSEWNSPANWSPAQVPTIWTDVTIPGNGVSNFPIISTSEGAAWNLSIDSGASLTVRGNKMIIGKSIFNKGIFDAVHGGVEFKGKSAQYLSGETFKNKQLSDLIISNVDPSGVTIVDTINITNSVSFGNLNDAVLNSNGYLILKSDSVNTARISDASNDNNNGGNIINGEVIVERFIPAHYNRGWRQISSGVNSTESIHANWQEGAISRYDNPHPGFGTHISGTHVDQTNGFDQTPSGNPSLQIYDNQSGNFIPISNTNNLKLFATTPYFLFIRGDRSLNLDAYPGPWISSNTTIRAKGNIIQDYVTYHSNLFDTTAPSGGTNLIANPFASSINWQKVYERSRGISNYYIYWDPNIKNENQRDGGAYVTVDINGVSSNPYSNASLDIQGGQAFFVQANDTVKPTVMIFQSAKSPINNIKVFKPSSPPLYGFYSSLFINDSLGRNNADAVLVRFNSKYSTDIDDFDAQEKENINENIAIDRKGKYLAIESRPFPIHKVDTIPLYISHLNVKNYDFEFKPLKLESLGMKGELVDNFTGNRSIINFEKTTIIPFNVTIDSLSNQAKRFYILLYPTLKNIPSDTLPSYISENKIYKIKTDSSITVLSGITQNTLVEPFLSNTYNCKPGMGYSITHEFHTRGFHTVTVYHSDIRGMVGFDGWQNSGAPMIYKNLRGYFPDELLHFIFNGTKDSTLNTFKEIKNRGSITKVRMLELASNDRWTHVSNYNFGDFSGNHDLRYINLENIEGIKLNTILPDIPNNFPKLSGLIVDGSMYSSEVQLLMPNASYIIIQNGLKSAQVDTILNQLGRSARNSNGQIYLKYGDEPRTSASDGAVNLLQSRGWKIFTSDGSGFVPPVPADYGDSGSYKSRQYSTFSNYFSERLGRSYSDDSLSSLFMQKCGYVPPGCVALQLTSKVSPQVNLSVPGPMGPMLCGRAAADSGIVINMDPCADTMNMAREKATYLYELQQKVLKGSFEDQYRAKCLEAVNRESFTVIHPVNEYHYTLYYYDQAGNLIKTVPPEGVEADYSTDWQTRVATAKAAGQALGRPHRMATMYRYNSLNQVVSQQTPDGGGSRFWYDRLGRLVVSQNAKQQQTGDYSYTLYDVLGRMTEVGQKRQQPPMTDAIARDDKKLKGWLAQSYRDPSGVQVLAEQVTRTVYDSRDPGVQAIPSGYIIDNTFQKDYTLRNRVSYRRYYDHLGVSGGTILYTEFNSSMTYSYDIHGNVDTLLNTYRTGLMGQMGLNRFKVMAYDYDLISGKINQVHYQPGLKDGYYHRYDYDAENRLTDVYTTTRKELIGISGLEEHEAFYQYYKHGPLARMVLGTDQVQGVDYAYTLQGWLKGVNATSLNPGFDMGQDGTTNQSTVARDAVSFNLNYFTGDYSAINKTVSPFAGYHAFLNDNRQLYNGNISSMAVNIGQFKDPVFYNYGYDQLNRLVSMDTYKGLNESTNDWSALHLVPDYRERISYDGNGNIKDYQRNGQGATLLNNLSYGYNIVNGKVQNNQLAKVSDAAVAKTNNYGYDKIGNLQSDDGEKISNIDWSVYGKIRSITKAGNNINYSYDASGNRISKIAKGVQTWYVRDGSGQVMSVYTKDQNVNNGKLTQGEVYLYGSSRLGVYTPGADVENLGIGKVVTFEKGKKFFELSNHLGNVLTTISDRKIAHSSDGKSIDYYTAEVKSASDYYPFGLEIKSRSYSSNLGFRYGFNGKEKDKDIDGENYDYGARILNPLVGRFLSIDPLQAKYPNLTPYQFASNSPIANIDLDGLEKYHYTLTFDKQGDTHIQLSGTEHFSEWQWKPKWGGTSLGFQLYEKIEDPRKEYIVQYSFPDYLVVGGAAAQVTSTYSSVFTSENEALNAKWSDFDGAAHRAEFAKGLMAGIDLPGIPLKRARAASQEEGVQRQIDASNGKENINTNLSGTAGKVASGTIPSHLVERYNKLNKKDRSGKAITSAGKDISRKINENFNGGNMKCDNCGIIVLMPKKDTRGIKTPMNSAEADHHIRQSENGRGNPDNVNIFCKGCNLDKH